jgi:hypothetical protein
VHNVALVKEDVGVKVEMCFMVTVVDAETSSLSVGGTSSTCMEEAGVGPAWRVTTPMVLKTTACV